MELLTDILTVFCDSDGVLRDFDRHVFDMFGQWPVDMNDSVMWENINAHTDEFWGTMPIKFGAQKLWETVVEHSPTAPIILTGCHKDAYDEIAAHKVTSHRRDFGEDVQIITCLSRNKPLYMKAPGDILIDDMSRNCRRWIKAGGRAVHYRTWEQAIADFLVMINTPYVAPEEVPTT